MSRHRSYSSERLSKSVSLIITSIFSGLIVLLIAMVTCGSSASAAEYQRPVKEPFGSTAQPTFSWAKELAVDPATGDVLVSNFDSEAAQRGEAVYTIQRFRPDGTAAPFAALGTNVIDGKEGPGGKPCSEEPESCDETPQNGIEFSLNYQIAVDDSGGPTDGNIYFTQSIGGGTSRVNVVDVFSSEGRYLGQITRAGTVAIEPCGVAVDPSGAVYIGSGSFIYKYVPTANPPRNSDMVARFRAPQGTSYCELLLGTGPTASSLFTLRVFNSEPVSKLDKETGVVEYTFDPVPGKTGAINPVSGNVLVSREEEVVEFDASGATEAIETSRFFTEHPVNGLGLDSAGEVYVSEGPTDRPLKVYGPPGRVPTLEVDPASNVTTTEATLSGSVIPEGLEVDECLFEWWTTGAAAETAACEGPIPPDSDSHPVHVGVSGLAPNGTIYRFRLVARNANGTVRSPVETFTTAQTVRTEAATAIGLDGATLNGSVRPEGHPYTACVFEWGLASNAAYEHTVKCDPEAADIPVDSGPQAVDAEITRLQQATSYRVRLVATNAEGTQAGEPITFETAGPPKIVALRASNATRNSAVIEAEINPTGLETSYRFEWGSGLSYGNISSANAEPIGPGRETVRVTADISGLSEASTYHFRVIASNRAAGGTVTSDDQTLETLNACGLPDKRCFELVSSPDPGPIATPGLGQTGLQPILFRPAQSGPAAIAYKVGSGYPDSTRSLEVMYLSRRGADGWDSTQVSPPITARNETDGGGSNSDSFAGFSKSLSCAVLESNQPLTDDATTKLVIEAGGVNLYRRNPDGSYSAISNLAPENPTAKSTSAFKYDLAGLSQDCGKVAFTATYRYPGLAATNAENFYEWDEGTLRNAGLVPGPSGEVPVEATPGWANAVSETGSRVFFSAERKSGPNVGEAGHTGVFVREDGSTTSDLSTSETSTPDVEAAFQYATPDGSRVFFTANSGLTSESSSEGTDLYEYDFERPAGERLTDLSVDHDTGGAQVQGLLGASEDGSHAYFVARGQLIADEGPTLAENENAGTYSIYGSSGSGTAEFLGTVAQNDLRAVIFSATRTPTSRVSADGRYVLFESSTDITGYESDGAREAYLYDADEPSGATVTCISCRQDGEAPFSASYSAQYPESVLDATPGSSSLVVGPNGPMVFFHSLDPLAPGAREGETSVYEWSHGQVFRLVTEPAGIRQPFNEGYAAYVHFFGANPGGSDVYLQTPESLTWEDSDGRSGVYDARIGGGFPEPPPPSAPCDPNSEGSCQGASSGTAAPTPGVATKAFSGQGNVGPKPKRHPKRSRRTHKKHRHHYKHRHDRKKRGKLGHPRTNKHRNANGNRRAGK